MLTAPPPAPGGQRLPDRYTRNFFVAMAASALFFAALQLLTPVLPLYTLAVGSDEVGWGLTTTIVSGVAVAVRLAGGPIADRLGRKGVMVAGAAAAVVAGLIMLVGHSFVGLLVGRILQGLGIGLFTTAHKALTIDLAPAERRGEAVGLGNLTFGLAGIIALPLGEWLLVAWGYSVVFVVDMVIAALCLAGALLVKAHDHIPNRRTLLNGVHVLFPCRSMQAGIWGMLSVAAPFSAVYTFLPLLAGQRALSNVGLALSVCALFDMVGQPLGGRLGDTAGRRLVIVPSLLLAAGGVYLLWTADRLSLMCLGAGCVGLGTALTRVSLDTLVLEGAPADLRATATGLQYAGIDIWIGLLGWMLGLTIVRAGYDITYAVMAGIPVMLAVVLSFLVPPGHGLSLDRDAGPATGR